MFVVLRKKAELEATKEKENKVQVGFKPRKKRRDWQKEINELKREIRSLEKKNIYNENRLSIKALLSDYTYTWGGVTITIPQTIIVHMWEKFSKGRDVTVQDFRNHLKERLFAFLDYPRVS